MLFRMRANLLRCILPATWIAGQLRTALASLTGIYQTYLSRVERGQVMPSVITLMQIAGALGVDKLILRLRSSLKTIVSRLTYLTSCPDNPLNVPILAHSGLARIAVHLNPRIIMLLGIETTIYRSLFRHPGVQATTTDDPEHLCWQLWHSVYGDFAYLLITSRNNVGHYCCEVPIPRCKSRNQYWPPSNFADAGCKGMLPLATFPMHYYPATGALAI
jgi:transcriptional regulator with XRE-family HTH domain